jgi:hypothetical protein
VTFLIVLIFICLFWCLFDFYFCFVSVLWLQYSSVLHQFNILHSVLKWHSCFRFEIYREFLFEFETIVSPFLLKLKLTLKSMP